MRELTLDQMGKEISAAIQTLTLAQRKAIGEVAVKRVEKACWNFEEGRMTRQEVNAGIARLLLCLEVVPRKYLGNKAPTQTAEEVINEILW